MTMQRIVKYFFVTVTITLCSISGFSQCDDEGFLDKCSGELKDFTFVKSFESSGKQEFSYVFSKDHNYLLTVCDQVTGGGRMVVSLYDRNHKLILTSYNKATKKYYPSVGYKCTATGVYYIETSFDENAKGCGVSILGFKK